MWLITDDYAFAGLKGRLNFCSTIRSNTYHLHLTSNPNSFATVNVLKTLFAKL